MLKSHTTILSAVLYSAAVLSLGYVAFGLWPMLVFTSGFLGGLVLWLLIPSTTSWSSIKAPYIAALLFFALHRVEEKMMDFFAVLSEITGVTTPNILSPQVILLVLTSVGAWLLIPYLIKHNNPLGYYFAWTFFAAMGITELAHFIVFPFFTENPFTYFPGMLTVLFLAPMGWWGMWRLRNK